MKTISRRRYASGFSLIEVLIALVVLAFGLLGLALLQTVNLRYTQSANQRTQAVNLAGQLLDTMRSNRSEAAAYYVTRDVSGVAFDPATGCPTPAALGAASNLERWLCEVRETLGPNASVIVGPNAVNAELTDVTVAWVEINANPLTGEGRITLSTEL